MDFLSRLPYELYDYILRYLDFHDLVNLRLVSDKFKGVIQDYKLKELVLVYNSKSFNGTFCLINKRISYRYVVNCSILSKMDKILKHNVINLKGLKKVKIDLIKSKCEFDLADLNAQFSQIQHLELKINHSNFKYTCLSLPNLITLGIETYYIKLSIDAEKLERLSLDIRHGNPKLFHIFHPESIKHLRVRPLCRVFPPLPNLEYLECTLWSTIGKDALNGYPKLKQLQIYQLVSYTFFNLPQIFTEIINSKLDGKNFDLFYNGVKISSVKEILNNQRRDHLQFQLENWSKTAPQLSWIESINFSGVRALINQTSNFFSKYDNIKVVKVSSRVDSAEFTSFLNGCRNTVHSLSTIGSGLDQAFYDNIASLLILTYLKIVEKTDMQFDFRFVLKLERIRVFETNQEFLRYTDLCLKKNFNMLKFKIHGHVQTIQKDAPNRYHLNNLRKNLYTFDELINYVNSLKEENGRILTRSKVKKQRT